MDNLSVHFFTTKTKLETLKRNFNLYGKDAISESTVRRWFVKF